MLVFDTHAHLDHVENIEAVLGEAYKAGVVGVVAVGVDLKANIINREIKKKFSKPKIFLGLGLHPGNIKTEEIDITLNFIREHIKEAVAIGEIGLDFWYRWVRKSDEKKTEQKEVFRKLLRIAKENDIPVTIHSRGAWKHCLEAVREAGVSKGVFHWYSGPLDVLRDVLDLGYYVSCTPSLAYSPEAQAAMKFVPLERALVETDSPVFFKDNNNPEKGFQAAPKDVFRTLFLYASLKGLKPEDAVLALNANAQAVFGLEV